MRLISKKVREHFDRDPYYRRCSRTDDLENCRGRITMEHAWIYSGRQIDEIWAIIPLCVHHHLCENSGENCQHGMRGGLRKRLNELISLRRATPEDLEKYPRRDWWQLLSSLEARYGSIIPKDGSKPVHGNQSQPEPIKRPIRPFWMKPRD